MAGGALLSGPRVVVLGGAGAMGRITARDLARHGVLAAVVADQAAGAAPAPGVEVVAVDVKDPASLARALDGAFVVVATLPYRLNLEAMRGALAAGANYLDLGGLFHMTRRQLELHEDFERAGVMAVLGIGSAPGIVNVLAAAAARELDDVREIHIQVASVDRTEYASAPPLGFDYSIDTLLDEYMLESAVYRGGQFRMVPALDPREQITVRFPDPVGEVTLQSTLHSEVATLAPSFAGRGVREVTFRQGFDAGFQRDLALLVRLGLADTEPLPGLGVAPRSVLLRLLARFPRAVVRGKPDRYEILRAHVRGTRGGAPQEVIADCHVDSHAGDGDGTDTGTGAPPSVVAHLLHDGRMRVRPGVWAPEVAVPIEPFLDELRARGMRVDIHRA